jgi:DNA-binding XRE family transcriptional regulator
MQLGVTRVAVSNWETGKAAPKLRHVVAICSKFECTTDELMSGRAGAKRKRAA